MSIERLNEVKDRLAEIGEVIGNTMQERDKVTRQYDEMIRKLRGEQEALNAERSTLIRRVPA